MGDEHGATTADDLNSGEAIRLQEQVEDLTEQVAVWERRARERADEVAALRAELEAVKDQRDRLNAKWLAEHAEVERMRRWMERAINDGGIDHHFVDAYRAAQQEATDG